LQGMLRFGHSEPLLRAVPTVAGALFPWFVMLWTQRFAGNAAALSAQLLLTFSPTMIDLSTEVRGYSLAFLFLSICLVFLDKSLGHGCIRGMAWFHFYLYLAILTEYCVAWFVAALGVYAFLRLRRVPASGRLRMAWGIGQVGALGLYLFLYFANIARWTRGFQVMYTTWLNGGFPRPHEYLLLFALHGTLRQFLYMFQLRPLAGAGAIFFPYGLYRLWRERSRLHVILIAFPFCVACLAALLHLFPYGCTRHTAILGIAIAAGTGSAVAGVTRGRIFPILAAALPVIFIWNILSTDAYLPIARYRRHLLAMHEATEFLGSSIPAGSLILTDAGTALTLGYYLGCPDYGYEDSDEPYRMWQCDELHFVVAPTFQFGEAVTLRDALFKVRIKYHSPRPLWVAAGGFGLVVRNPVSDSRPFGKTISILQDIDLQGTSTVHPY